MKKRKQEKPGSRDGDLSFLLKPIVNRNKAAEKRLRGFVRLAKRGKTTLEIAKELKCSDFTVVTMRQELKQAARKGYSLKKYIQAGRPFRQGNKQLA